MEKEIEKRIKTSIEVAESLWRDVKIYAARKGLKLVEIFDAALRKYLELAEREEAEKAKKAEKPKQGR